MTLPLLIKGFFANENLTNNTIVGVAAVPIQWNNTITEGRGDLVMLDVIASNLAAVDGTTAGMFSVSIGGMVVLQNQEIIRYAVTAFPRSFEFLQLAQPPGQTIEFSYLPTATVGGIVHCYHFNQFAIPSIVAARNTAALKQRIVSFRAAFVFNVPIAESEKFTIPSGIGNVVGIELNTYIDDPADDVALRSVVSVLIGGIKVFDDVSAMLFFPGTGRPGLIFPCLVRPGQTFVFQANTDAATVGTLTVEIRLYFDDDRTGKRNYV